MPNLETLEEDLRKTKLEIEFLNNIIFDLRRDIELNKEKMQLVDQIYNTIPEDIYIRKSAKIFHESNEEIQIEEFFEKHQKYIQESTTLYVEDNKILFNNKEIGNVNDVRFSKFLNKVFKVLPFLIYTYSRYAHFSGFIAEINKYEYFGKKYTDLSKLDKLIEEKNNK